MANAVGMETKNGLETPPDAAQAAFGHPAPETSHWLVLRKRAVMFGTAALASLGVAWKYMNQPENAEHFLPTVHRVATVDNIQKFGSWNMHGEAAERTQQIRQLARSQDLDALALQEVSQSDVAPIEQAMPEWHIVYKLADKKQHILEGGYGNMILTRQPPRDIQSRTFKGTSLGTTATRTVAGAGEDLIDGNANLANTRNGLQENRAAVAETIRLYSSGKLIDVRLATAHLAGHLDPHLHQRQLSGLLAFLKENTKPDRPTIFMGDLNAGSTEVIPAFASIGFVSPDTGGTSVTSGRTIDHVAYYVSDGLGLAKVSVLKNPKTDHYPLVAEWDLKP